MRVFWFVFVLQLCLKEYRHDQILYSLIPLILFVISIPFWAGGIAMYASYVTNWLVSNTTYNHIHLYSETPGMFVYLYFACMSNWACSSLVPLHDVFLLSSIRNLLPHLATAMLAVFCLSSTIHTISGTAWRRLQCSSLSWWAACNNLFIWYKSNIEIPLYRCWWHWMMIRNI